MGTISIDELAHAIQEDIQILKDIYNIHFVRASRLKLFATDEFGAPVNVMRPAGGQVNYMNTSHYRPACLDYKL